MEIDVDKVRTIQVGGSERSVAPGTLVLDARMQIGGVVYTEQVLSWTTPDGARLHAPICNVELIIEGPESSP